MRLFFAVELDAALREGVTAAMARVRDGGIAPRGLRWLGAEQLHVTLQFLGDVEAGRVAELESSARAAAAKHAAFELSLGAPATFGSARRARLLHCGLAAGRDAVIALVTALQAHTAPLGFAAERRELVPHVTLARLRQPADVSAVLAALRMPAEPMRVEQVTLFRSHLAQSGARYEPLARVPLG
jgi:2'-5' RNA ligase